MCSFHFIIIIIIICIISILMLKWGVIWFVNSYYQLHMMFQLILVPWESLCSVHNAKQIHWKPSALRRIVCNETSVLCLLCRQITDVKLPWKA